jgi:hypothetical protein
MFAYQVAEGLSSAGELDGTGRGAILRWLKMAL